MGNGFARRHDQVLVVNLALKQGRKRIDCATPCRCLPVYQDLIGECCLAGDLLLQRSRRSLAIVEQSVGQFGKLHADCTLLRRCILHYQYLHETRRRAYDAV